MKSSVVGIVRFPGTNCDRDVWEAVEAEGHRARWLWHADLFDVRSVDRIILAGGFSYGDYLRAGALAARSPVMRSIQEAAARGTPVLGICNGFQILCEVGLLPGALVLNTSMKFIDEWAPISLKATNRYWGGSHFSKGTKLNLPIAHAEGRFYTENLQELLDRNQVWWTYENNPNGSLGSVAGVMNREGHVAGLMSHPERAVAEWMGCEQGKLFFKSDV